MQNKNVYEYIYAHRLVIIASKECRRKRDSRDRVRKHNLLKNSKEKRKRESHIPSFCKRGERKMHEDERMDGSGLKLAFKRGEGLLSRGTEVASYRNDDSRNGCEQRFLPPPSTP